MLACAWPNSPPQLSLCFRQPDFRACFRQPDFRASSPNLNAHAERFVRTIKESCLERMILFCEDSLRKAIHEFIEHYHHERNHQGLGNRLIIQEPLVADSAAAVQSRSRLGGMLNYYYRQAA